MEPTEATQEGTTQELSDEQMDSLLEGETPQEIPMETPKEEAPQEYTLKVNDQEIKAPIDKLIQWAQMGYDYGEKMKGFKNQQSEFEKSYSTYQQVDSWAKENPELWQHVLQSYQDKESLNTQGMETEQGQEIDPSNPLSGKLTELEQKLKELEEFKQNEISEREAKRRAQEDAELESQIQDVRKTYPDIDLNEVDENGNSLETRVYNFAVEKGISNFKDAFNLFNHERLLQRAELLAKEKFGKDIQSNTKLGLLGKSSTPTKGLQSASDIKNKSYEDLQREIEDELGIA